MNLRTLPVLVLLALPAWTAAQRASPAPAQVEREAESIPDSAFAFLQPLRGESGALRVAFRAAPSALSPRKPAPGMSVLYQGKEGDALASDRVPELPGVYDIVVKSGEMGRKADDLKADIWVDNDGDGAMDDLNGDKRVDMDDSREVAAAAERVEDRYPALAGGIGPYPACCGHGPFTHVDARGSRARWEGPHGQAAPKPAPSPAKRAPGSDRD